MFQDIKAVLREVYRLWKHKRAVRARRASIPDPFQ